MENYQTKCLNQRLLTRKTQAQKQEYVTTKFYLDSRDKNLLLSSLLNESRGFTMDWKIVISFCQKSKYKHQTIIFSYIIIYKAEFFTFS